MMNNNEKKVYVIVRCDCGHEEIRQVKDNKDVYDISDMVLKDNDEELVGIKFVYSCSKCRDEELFISKWEKKQRIINRLYNS